MKIIINMMIVVCLLFGAAGPGFSQIDGKQRSLYQRHFSEKVHKFGNRNKFNIANINRDKYVNCYMQVGIEVTIAADGSIKNLSVKEPSPVPLIDKYFSYIVKQAAPFDPLDKYFSGNPSTITFVNKFRLDLNLYENTKVTKACG